MSPTTIFWNVVSQDEPSLLRRNELYANYLNEWVDNPIYINADDDRFVFDFNPYIPAAPAAAQDVNIDLVSLVVKSVTVADKLAGVVETLVKETLVKNRREDTSTITLPDHAAVIIDAASAEDDDFPLCKSNAKVWFTQCGKKYHGTVQSNHTPKKYIIKLENGMKYQAEPRFVHLSDWAENKVPMAGWILVSL